MGRVPRGGQLRVRGSGRLYLVQQAWREVEAQAPVHIEETPDPVNWVGGNLFSDAARAPGTGCLVYRRRNGMLEIYAG